MLSIEEAIQRILATVKPLDAVSVPLAEARGLTLAEPIVSEIDSPPFDKSMMDGYAVRTADLTAEGCRLRVTGEIVAGAALDLPVRFGEAIRIMTGAPIPEGADAVVRLEDAQANEESGTVAIAGQVPAGTNILRRGTVLRSGEQLLAPGRVIRPQEMALLAELGAARVRVYPRPLVGVLATGDELVEIAETPGPGQIRNSNATMLAAQLEQMGCRVRVLGIGRDNQDDLLAKVSAGLECDVLCLSGGVSAGKRDLVPQVLGECGVAEVFHKVHLRPGKPIWFGRLPAGSGAAEGRDRYVFGLPGNPVSSMVCCALFVSQAIRALTGSVDRAGETLFARLSTEVDLRDERPTYVPCRLQWNDGGLEAAVVAWQGSADLRSTADSDALAVFPQGQRTYAAGERVEVLRWDR